MSNVECDPYSASNRITGEAHANRDLEDVQVGYGKDSFTKVWSGWWYESIRFGEAGSHDLGSMEMGDSRVFVLNPDNIFLGEWRNSSCVD